MQSQNKEFNLSDKCSDCKRLFGSGYKDSLIDNTCQQCDVFEWCWDCDDAHTIKEIEDETTKQKSP